MATCLLWRSIEKESSLLRLNLQNLLFKAIEAIKAECQNCSSWYCLIWAALFFQSFSFFCELAEDMRIFSVHRSEMQ